MLFFYCFGRILPLSPFAPIPGGPGSPRDPSLPLKPAGPSAPCSPVKHIFKEQIFLVYNHVLIKIKYKISHVQQYGLLNLKTLPLQVNITFFFSLPCTFNLI